jgi:Rad3-related DNA helicase
VNPAAIDAEFPAPAYRGVQDAAIADITEAYASGAMVVIVRAPTGTGKSLLARAIAGAADPEGKAYYTTPQVSQLDDVGSNPLLDDIAIIRGKRNYGCILPGDRGQPVNQARCARDSNFECPEKQRCPYFVDRTVAAEAPIAGMTLAYFMQTAGSELFDARDVIVIDEAHGLLEWAEMYATIRLGPQNVPGWETLTIPRLDSPRPDRPVVEAVEEIHSELEATLAELEGAGSLSPQDVLERDRLRELVTRIGWFRRDVEQMRHSDRWVVDQAAETAALAIKPLNPAPFLRHTVWDRGTRFALLSATILDPAAYCRGVGLPSGRVRTVDVPHTFPLEHRPLFDVMVGEMTYDVRGQTLPKIGRLLVQLLAMHPDTKGLVHCHSYAIQQQLFEQLAEVGATDRVVRHTPDDRDAVLERWKQETAPEVLLSVKMEEALDLHDDLCRWQVLCKAPYLNTSDSRVQHRLDAGAWDWYNRMALRRIIQACGRVVRSADDHGATYLADASIGGLFERSQQVMPAWFRDQVDAMRRPSLPPYAEALAAVGGAERPSGRPQRTRRSDSTLDGVWGDE